MGDFLMAIWADRNTCKPYAGPGRVGHVVRVSSDAQMTVINEFTDGGANEHADCAPASFQSWLLDKTTTRTTIPEIEQLAGTTANGTGWKGIEVAGLHFGYQIHFVTEDPLPGFVMNPGGGFIDPPSTFASYLAATQGGCLVLPNVGPIPKPTPAPQQPTEDEEMYFLVTIADQPNAGVYRLGGGFYVGVYTPADEAAFKAAGDKPLVISAGQHQRYLAAAPKAGA